MASGGFPATLKAYLDAEAQQVQEYTVRRAQFDLGVLRRQVTAIMQYLAEQGFRK